jgi:hypothetical protein
MFKLKNQNGTIDYIPIMWYFAGGIAVTVKAKSRSTCGLTGCDV